MPTKIDKESVERLAPCELQAGEMLVAWQIKKEVWNVVSDINSDDDFVAWGVANACRTLLLDRRDDLNSIADREGTLLLKLNIDFDPASVLVERLCDRVIALRDAKSVSFVTGCQRTSDGLVIDVTDLGEAEAEKDLWALQWCRTERRFRPVWPTQQRPPQDVLATVYRLEPPEEAKKSTEPFLNFLLWLSPARLLAYSAKRGAFDLALTLLNKAIESGASPASFKTELFATPILNSSLSTSFVVGRSKVKEEQLRRKIEDHTGLPNDEQFENEVVSGLRHQRTALMLSLDASLRGIQDVKSRAAKANKSKQLSAPVFGELTEMCREIKARVEEFGDKLEAINGPQIDRTGYSFRNLSPVEQLEHVVHVAAVSTPRAKAILSRLLKDWVDFQTSDEDQTKAFRNAIQAALKAVKCKLIFKGEACTITAQFGPSGCIFQFKQGRKTVGSSAKFPPLGLIAKKNSGALLDDTK